MTDAIAAARDRLVLFVGLGLAGVGFVVVPPGEQERHAETLAAASRGARVELVELDGTGVSRVFVVPGLPRDPRRATAALAVFNGRRDLLHAADHLIVLVLTRRELGEVQRHASDVYSTRLFIEEIPFVPDPDVDTEHARSELGRWQRERFGRLDLRGFVRTETEDVAWRVEDIYQDLEATEMLFRRDGSVTDGPIEQRVEDWMVENRNLGDQLFVVLGHPGSGKTFLLRWLTVTLTERDSFADVTRPVPWLVSLAAYTETPGPIGLYEHLVETALEAGQPIAHALHEFVRTRRAVFLFDGLDEAGDESARKRIVSEIESLRERAPGCMVVATSRIAGYDGAVLPDATHLMLSPFGDEAIRRFLTRWCELYALDRSGDTPYARQEGRTEGERLAKDVLAHKDVRELARNPLLLTVLAIVHRTGVRLPDHRIELYEHATRVLVERWNRVRSLASTRPPPPLKTADAVRLLGPVALAMVRSGVHGVIAEEELRLALDRTLTRGPLRGLATADEAISLFRNSLGLLVEQSPGVYAFIHLTLAEYFASWELVRSHELEGLVSHAIHAFHPEWREVILLAAGELGVIRADDVRLEALVDQLIESAARRPGKPSPTVPSLLSGLLADDPGLSPSSIEKLANTLVPTWWFKRAYGAKDSLALVVREATALVRDRIRDGRTGNVLRDEILRSYGDGLDAEIRQNLRRGGVWVLAWFFRFLEAADVDNGPSLRGCVEEGAPGRRALERYEVPVRISEIAGDEITAQVSLSRSLDTSVRRGEFSLKLHGRFHAGRWRGLRSRGLCDWSQTRPTGEHSDGYVTLELRMKVDGLHDLVEPPDDHTLSGSVRIAFP